MKSKVLCGVSGLLISASALFGADDLAAVFKNPPQDAKPFTWWHWMSGNISKEGIVKDADAMVKAGYGGLQLFNITQTGLMPGPIYYGSEKWWELLDFAAEEMSKRNLDFGMTNGAGWATTGGPHISPAYAIQQLVWTEKQIADSSKDKIVLEKFDKNIHKHVTLCPSTTMSQGVDLPQKDEWQRKFYKDIIVFAFPTPKDELNGAEGHRLKDWQLKSGNKGMTPTAKIPRDTAVAPYPIDEKSIIDITDKMTPDGSLDWAPPANSGTWTVIRMGHIITGKPCHPAPEGGRGLEADKFSAEAARFHFYNGILPFIKKLNTPEKKRLTTILTDSFEAKTQNWSPALPAEFKALRGYDILKYMTIFTGRVINSTDFTERFLWDFRRTAADLIAKNHYGVLQELCNQYGVKFSAEAYGHPADLDNIETAMKTDIPMSEFWVGAYGSGQLWNSKEAATVSDLMNRKIVGAEAFTSGEDFHSHAGSLKSQGDYYYTYGVNRFLLHGYSHQPFIDGVFPGASLYLWGSHMHRLNPWWNVQMPLWSEYISRVQSLLQRGALVADACFYAGESAQVEIGYRNSLDPKDIKAKKASSKRGANMTFKTDLSEGYDFHLIARTFLSQMSVKDGKIVHSSGKEYEVLFIYEEDFWRLEIAKILEKLVSEGGKIVAVKPIATPGLEGLPNSDTELKDIAEKMWAAPLNSDGYRVYGKGRIYEPAENVEKIMKTLKVAKDFDYRALDKASENLFLRYIHRKTENESYYFVSNQSDKAVKAACTFRVSGYVPEIWDAQSGEIFEAPAWSKTSDGRMEVLLDLAENESLFVVFRKKSQDNNLAALNLPENGARLCVKENKLYLKAFKNESYKMTLSKASDKAFVKDVLVSSLSEPLDIKSGWSIKFPTVTGSGNTVELDSLKSWARLENFDDKHFSGTAEYDVKFNIPTGMLGKDIGVNLDLGTVEVVAEVFINGKHAGTAWVAPYVLDVTKFVKEGANEMKIKLTSTLKNRLIGDQHYDNPYLSKDTVNERIGRKPNSGGFQPQYEKYYEEKYVLIADWLYDATKPRPDTKRKAFMFYNPYKATTPLIDSGLIGPVVVRPYKLVGLN